MLLFYTHAKSKFEHTSVVVGQYLKMWLLSSSEV
ncbi:hypothetical protein F383_17196 [Gossypium arboreum]|uniref:Uncharacterized protein n=1 Tax=Gossypium arboreum TaxID=29729 RepID=A0A0B0MCS4_GOSAR|nr:hypothetical protein F383_17196 [Gossypium arboreum]